MKYSQPIYAQPRLETEKDRGYGKTEQYLESWLILNPLGTISLGINGLRVIKGAIIVCTYRWHCQKGAISGKENIGVGTYGEQVKMQSSA